MEWAPKAANAGDDPPDWPKEEGLPNALELEANSLLPPNALALPNALPPPNAVPLPDTLPPPNALLPNPGTDAAGSDFWPTFEGPNEKPVGTLV